MTVPGNYETRKAYREALVQILDTIRGVDSYYISLDQCIEANIIEPTPLVLDNHSPLKPHFFSPYLGHRLLGSIGPVRGVCTLPTRRPESLQPRAPELLLG